MPSKPSINDDLVICLILDWFFGLMMRIAFLVLVFSLLAVAAFADEAPKLRTSVKDWQVFTQKVDGDLVCYVQSKAQDKAPRNVNHGDVVFFVGSWKSGAAHEQPSLMTGYSVRVKSPPKARVGSTKVTMFGIGNEAFVDREKDEKRLVRAMRQGATLRVEAMSERGTATAYEFSLSGITAALQKAGQLCS